MCNRQNVLFGLFVAMGCLLLSCATLKPPVFQPDVQFPDIEGVWHEVARLPLTLENNCAAFSFEFKADGENKMRINGYCWYRSMNGPMRRSDATVALSKQSDKKGHFWLQFAGPVVGEYGILHLSADGRQMIIGAPNRKHLWIMSRDLKIDPSVKADLIQRIKAQGYDTTALIHASESQP